MNPSGLYNTTATLRTPSNSQQGDGSIAVNFTNSTFACAINPMGPKEVIQYQRPFGTIMARLYCALTPVITQAHEVVWGGFTWKVFGPPIDTGGRSIFQKVILERIE